MMHLRDEKDMAGCAISGIMSEAGRRFSGETIIRSIANMHERSNGLGGGFAAYGIYPEHADKYAFHIMFDYPSALEAARAYLGQSCLIAHEEVIPTRRLEVIRSHPILHRFFIELKPHLSERYCSALSRAPAEPDASCPEGPLPQLSGPAGDETEEDMVVRIVMHINRNIDGAFVMSSGKNMGVFKGVGYPEDIGQFFRLEEYEAYIWLAHGRFPTNTAGWWGGAHPFGLLDWAVVHNGEISSYGINRRYLENFGYHCTLHTDTEVICYLFDLLMRKHGLPLEVAASAFAPPFWSRIDRMGAEERTIARTLRIVYGGALLNGPFSVVVGHSGGIIGLNDRTKLRPMVAARNGDLLYLASEEAAIREVCDSPDEIWHAEGGVPIVGRFKEKAVAQ